MYDTIKTWIGTLFTAVNATISGTTNDFAEVTIGWDFENLPNSQTDKYYQTKIVSFEEGTDEVPGHCIVTVAIEQWYLMANDNTNYKTAIDTYIRGLYKQLRAFRGYKSTTNKFAIYELSGIQVSGLDNIIEENWLNPKLTLTLRCIESY